MGTCFEYCFTHGYRCIANLYYVFVVLATNMVKANIRTMDGRMIPIRTSSVKIITSSKVMEAVVVVDTEAAVAVTGAVVVATTSVFASMMTAVDTVKTNVIVMMTEVDTVLALTMTVATMYVAESFSIATLASFLVTVRTDSTL